MNSIQLRESGHILNATPKLIVSSHNNIIPALDIVTLENMHNYFRKVRHYMFGYLEGIPGGGELEKLVEDYKQSIKAHRRISEFQ